MKIRIKGNSVRFRLTKTEVAAFCKYGAHSESTYFADQKFTYSLVARQGIEHLQADYKDNTIRIYMPSSIRKTWEDSDVVGYNHKMKLPTGKELFLLVEKDFVCLDETTEDQSDNYPNPKSDLLLK